MTDAEFLSALEDTSLPESSFQHRDHLRAGYLYLRRDGFFSGMGAMASALRRYAAARGRPDRYHETLTVAYLTLINERLQLEGDAGGFDAFIARNPDLAAPGILHRFYRRETLSTKRARQVFVLEEPYITKAGAPGY
ncbi:MAG TPA: hypothetical protein VJR58_17620 [Vineibacter sp.]|nr:hypothetical protein [Vineibacter sp.]